MYLCFVIMCWFAAKTRQRSEFKAEEFFNSVGINAYVPSFQTKRIWSDRIKKVIVPAINGYVFFELSKLNYSLLNSNPYTKNIVKNINGLPAVISEDEISTLKNHVNGRTCSSDLKLEKGQNIKIQSGPFMFKKGVINKISDNKVVINLKSINISLVLNRSSVMVA